MAHPYQKECGAKTRAGHPCKAPAMVNGRCRKHGGKSLAGPAAGAYRTGIWSKILPVKMAARQHIGAKDVRLLELRQEISLIDTFIADLMEQQDLKTSKQWFKELKSCVEDVIGTQYDLQAQTNHLRTLKKLIETRGSRYEIQAEIGKHIDRRQRLVESERKRMIEARQMISLEQMMVLIGSVIKIVTDVVKDRTDQTLIANKIRKLIDADVIDITEQELQAIPKVVSK